jgi:hypothetical protein
MVNPGPEKCGGRVLLDLGPLRGPAAPPDSVLVEARDGVVAFMRSHHGRILR